jgi:hypothetical protein
MKEQASQPASQRNSQLPQPKHRQVTITMPIISSASISSSRTTILIFLALNSPQNLPTTQPLRISIKPRLIPQRTPQSTLQQILTNTTLSSTTTTTTKSSPPPQSLPNPMHQPRTHQPRIHQTERRRALFHAPQLRHRQSMLVLVFSSRSRQVEFQRMRMIPRQRSHRENRVESQR